ncbi:hypothetical protein, partial [Alkalibacillus haloalkaliphilus]|uniref:hypothetical protein n=1 Tax=Alkalibacillus haloalkaliphilus TaxID=94136 RepID=UPI0029360597
MREDPQTYPYLPLTDFVGMCGSKYLISLKKILVKMLLTRGKFAWVYEVLSLMYAHQRLNVEHLYNYKKITSNNITAQTLNQNKELFHEWLVGFTDG